MTWEEIMRRVLPPVSGLSPHVTSEFGATNRPRGSTNPHRAIDFNYDVGPNGQRGINLTHPTVHSPVAGVVTNTGGKYGIVAIRDANGLSHEILHTQTRNVRKGDLVGVGTPIGTMGSTGADARHVHYQLKDRAGKVVNPMEFWNNLDAGKDDPGQPAFLDQSQRGAEIISGLDEKLSRNDGSLPDRPGNPFFNPFDQAPVAGFVPLPKMPAASDGPTNFTDRFGEWAAKPGFGDVGAPAPQLAPNPGKRSELPNDGAPTSAQATSATNAPVASPPPLLGIFSGQPMPDYPVRPSIFATDDQSSPDDDELYQRWRRWLDA